MDKEYYMREALKEAKKAALKGEIPVGCVIVYDDKIIARGHNQKFTKGSALNHAEIVVIRKAEKKIKNYYLDGASMYVTLEPCPMCSGAIMQSRIKNLYYGAYDRNGGACGSIVNLFNYKFSNPAIYIEGGILEEECKDILQVFFKELREKKKKG